MRSTLSLALLVNARVFFAATPEPGLLFYLSGDRGFTADYAAGNPEPNYLANVKIIADGAKGKAFECANTQLMAYWAPGNIYAQRGTLAFSWRSRYPVGPTAFPIFRVAYADHSSWDMVWLRIDYNGENGFDAFVTDINLSRIRVSYRMPVFPKPGEWVHLALSWDETVGIRFYVNGVLAARKDQKSVLYTGLDQFGPHSRAISPWEVQSAYNFMRGGDIDEISIYDRMLSDGNVASVAKGVVPRQIPELSRELAKPQWQEEWWLRYGWNRKGDVPPYLVSANTSVRKVEIHDVYDLKRWWWKATDGIRETTWPGVYNRSRLPGRNDYFQLPDWDCYMLSGKAVTFTMPNEPWNQLESDDGDMTNDWPGLAYMGVEPEKVKQSDLKELDAFYNAGQFTKGLPTIQADDLHSYEEGISVLGQALLLDYGSPRQLERAMETARGAIGLTGVNKAGHLHIRTSYFNGEKMATEEPWGWSRPNSYLILHPGLMLVEFNGNPKMKKTILQLADGLLAHRKLGADGKYYLNSTIRFEDDQDEACGVDRLWPVLWAAWRWTGDTKYLAPLQDLGSRRFLELVNSDALDLLKLRDTSGKEVAASAKPGSGTDADQYLAWQVTGDKRYLESLFAHQIETSALREYINTEGSMWIDRVLVPEFELHRTRLGGVPLVRNYYYPGHAVSWKFKTPATPESVAILIPMATPDQMKIIAYNLDRAPVQATLTAWGIDPGKWEVAQGVDTRDDDVADNSLSTRTVELERSGDLELTLAPRATTVVTLKLVSRGTPYWERPDLGIGKEDVKIQGNQIQVTVHSLGSVDMPASTAALVDKSGKVLASVPVPSLTAPLDMFPKTAKVILTVPKGASITDASVVINPSATVKEVTRMNNRVSL